MVFTTKVKHLDKLKIILDKFATHGIIINFMKCQFMKLSVIFLDHVVSKEGLKPTDSKTLEIVKLQLSGDVNRLKNFYGYGCIR